MRLITILLTLAICSQAYAELTPNSISGALSIRTPTLETALFDFEISGDAEWDVLSVCTALEREDDTLYQNVAVIAEKGIYRNYYVLFSTKEKPAYRINRQTAVIGYKRRFVGIGAGAVTERYIADDAKGAVDFWIPLPNGSLTLTTDFNTTHIWRGETRIEFGVGKFRPFMLGVLYLDGSNEFYQIKCGVTYKPKENAGE